MPEITELNKSIISALLWGKRASNRMDEMLFSGLGLRMKLSPTSLPASRLSRFPAPIKFLYHFSLKKKK
jgi:hypothetical protein